MNDIAIKVDNVSKTFKLPHEKQTSIKSAVVNFYRRKRTFEKQEVLKNISFEIKKGEFFGIVGRNGSGKSTLLKLLAGIYTPDKGSIHINGKLTPFIELGVGFSPELTGRENVFLNGALLGFNRKEMDAMYDEIVQFAELEKFMDQKLKNYSSGMQVRLAFSIAIRTKSDILLFDEVLAVGDERFQNKCLEVFESIKRQGKTVVFVSHDMESVKRFCGKAVVIHNGELVFEGNASEAAMKYIKINFPELITHGGKQTTDSGIEVELKNSDGKASAYRHGEVMRVCVGWKQVLPVKNVGVAIFSREGHYLFGANTILDNIKVTGSKIEYELNLNLGQGKYYLQVGLFGDRDTTKIGLLEKAAEFSVEGSSSWQGATYLEHRWSN